MEFKEALDRIQKDDAKREKFYKDPKGELEALGVDTRNLKIAETRHFPSRGQAQALSICVTVGEIVGVTVGT